jgi:hypothetical protein
MADNTVVTVIESYARSRTIKIHVSGHSDGAGETNKILIDRSTLIAPSGGVPVALHLAEARYAVAGHSGIKITYDYTSTGV